MTITAEELEVLSFFEVQPKPTDEDIGWPYNDFLYEIHRGELHLSCAIAPAYQDVRIILRHRDDIIYELNAVGVDDVKYRKDESSEYLDIVISPNETVTLKVIPEIKLAHHAIKEP